MPASTIVDQHGRPFEVAPMQEQQTARVAMLQRDWATHPAKGLTPARLASILQDAEQGQPMAQLDLADDMLERDGHVYAELDKRAAVVVATPHQIAPPPNASAAEKALAEEVAEWVEELPLAQIKKAAMDAVLKSVSAQEIRWEMQGGALLPVSFEARPTRWLCPDERGTRWNLRDGSSAYGQPLLPGCWLLHRHRSLNGYMTRDGLVRVLAWPHLFKWASDTDLMEILEILGIPMRIGTFPVGASDTEKSRLMQAVVSLGRNAAGIMPAGMKIDLIKGAEGTEGPYLSMAQRMDAVQSKVIVGQTLTSGEGQHGTQALGNVHNEVRMDIRDADLAQLATTLTQQLLWPMVALNKPGVDPRRAPRWKWLTDQAEDLKTFAENLPKLAAGECALPCRGRTIGSKFRWRRKVRRCWVLPPPHRCSFRPRSRRLPRPPRPLPHAVPCRPPQPMGRMMCWMM
ncbi:hypothetical protein VITFI_CDS1064 [Vitreoscilla filiformis]|uniref:Mu-like prophage FluMu protein gp29 n=1 Tax=Vitreoscilla filiformis TaxID=63 RepID=A0A221KCU1_VITFI|nr:hypothetical protein VITFI_CDS1064 [Vitreoscilla filiformis]